MKTRRPVKIAILLLMTFSATQIMFAQGPPDPPPPNGGNQAGPDNELVGGGAPIGNGSIMLLIMAASYAATKWRKRKQNTSNGKPVRNKLTGNGLGIMAVISLLTFQSNTLLADTFTVANLNDAGDGSLRWAIEQVNATTGQHTIDFNVSGTITLVTALPSITKDYTIIDASSQWQGDWPAGAPGIVIDGTDLLDTSVGIYLNGASYCEIRGLHITNFAADQCKGILTFNSGNNNIIGGSSVRMRNVITNCYTGIELRSSYNTIIGNFIGVAPDGLTAAPNNQRGVYINQSYYNILGGTTEAERNVISGNTLYGVYIGGQNTIVKGNYIGVNKNGTVALPNGADGIIITEQNNTIGGTEAGAGNLISGNADDGIYVLGADNNTIIGNYLGTDKNGTGALGNGNAGVYIAGGSDNNIIGGTTASARNIISANAHSGVMITGSTQNQIEGNYIGTDVNGTADLGNTYYGVVLFGGAQSNTIGGTADGSVNVISGNNSSGVAIRQFNTNNNLVQGNYIGTTADGISHRGNSDHGVYIAEGAKYNTIGGTVAAARNIIGGNELSGVTVENNGTNGNIICGNYIGLNVLGNYRRNTDHGVYVRDGADGTIIGGDTENDRNIISCNNSNGINVGRTNYAETTNTIIKNNYIGTDPTGELDRGNHYYGIFVSAPSSNTQIIDNVISGNNGGSGINLKDGPNTVKGNTIGSDKDQETALPNSSEGIIVDCENNTIGGANAGEGNFIAWNGGDGIQIELSSNTVYGNTICYNDDHGIRIAGYGEHADNNIIGGTNTGEANTIHHNGIAGIQIYGMYDPEGYDFRYTDYNRISGNSIYDNTGLGIDLVESGNGPGTAPHISAPVLSTTSINSNTLHIEGSGAGTSATVEIFLADNASSGEGKTYLGSLTADASKAAGDFSGDLDVSGFDIAAGDNIVATTTHTDNNTSEFSSVSVVTEANTIISAQTGDWNSTATWIGGQIPTSTNDVIVYEGHTITVNSAQSCQKLTLQSDAELILMDVLPNATTGYDFAESSTVNYANAAKGDQTIEATVAYGNLILSGSGDKTANAALNVAGNLDINNSAVFLSNHALAVGGNLIANGTAQFNPAGNANINGSFTLSENSSCQNNGLLSVDGAILLQENAVLSLGNNLDANADMNIGADATLNGNSSSLFVGGNWSQHGTWNPGTGTVSFDKTKGNQNIGPSLTGSEVQVGTGTDSEHYYPFNNMYENNKTQMLYLSSDIGESGSIYAIQLNISVVSPEGYRDFNNFTVRLNHTSESNWDDKESYADMTNAVTVLSQNVYTLPSETGWFTINFDTPFAYDNTNNLIVEIVWGPNTYYTLTEYEVLTTDYPYNVDRVLYGRSDSQTPPPFYREEDKLPNMKFMFQGTGSREFYNLHVNKSAAENELTTVANLLINNNLEVVSGAFTASYNVEVTGNASVGSTSKSSSQITVEPDKSLTINGDLTLKNTGKILLKDTDDPQTHPGMLLPKQQLIVEGDGHCTAQRYYQGNQWHLVSSSLADATAGAFTGKVLQYHTENDNTWHDITSINHLLNPIQGYSLWAFSDEAVLGEFVGTPNAGIQTFDFVSSGGEGNGWNLVGNPYPATLDWDEVSIPDNLDATIYLWDPDMNDYRYYLPGGPSNTASQYVALAQGFFVHANNVAGGTLTFTPDAMTTESGTFYKSEKQEENTLIYQLENYPSTKGSVRFRADATEAFDPLLDAYRMTPGEGVPLVYTQTGHTKMAVNSLPEFTEPLTVEMGISANTGDYMLVFEGHESFSEAIPLYLKDNKTNTLTNLRIESTYDFTMEEGDEASRFELLFMETAGTEENQAIEAQLLVQGQEVFIIANENTFEKLQLFSLSGQLLTEREITAGNTSLHIATKGCYIIRLLGRDATYSSKVIIR
jgi:parallel beta-helix repeat protein